MTKCSVFLSDFYRERQLGDLLTSPKELLFHYVNTSVLQSSLSLQLYTTKTFSQINLIDRKQTFFYINWFGAEQKKIKLKRVRSKKEINGPFYPPPTLNITLGQKKLSMRYLSISFAKSTLDLYLMNASLCMYIYLTLNGGGGLNAIKR